MENKLISIIVAAYNIESYIGRCLDSLLAQTYEKLEMIVIDDGSTDQTGKICDSYRERDKRIQVIHQPNAGLSGARNAGLKAARGEYIGYVDGDDWVEPDMYRDMYLACEKNHAQVAVCAYRQIGGEQHSFSGETYVLTRDEVLDAYICDNRSFHIYNSVWSKLFARTLVEGMEFPIGKKSEDIMYTTEALVNCSRCVFLDSPYYNYVVDREDSIMNRGLHKRRFEDEIPFWREQIGYLEGMELEQQAKKAAYYFYRRMLFYYIDFRNKKMKASYKEMAEMLRKEKERIGSVYGNSFVAMGDKVRMRLFLFSPSAYYFTVKLYDKIIIPLRQ